MKNKHTSKSATAVKDEELLAAAKRAAYNSYSPYSHFRVGAALLCADGTIITGTNLENRSYGLTICAERTALGTAVTLGQRQFNRLAIYALDADYPLPPCGACRQVLSELAGPEFKVIFSGKTDKAEEKMLKELLPFDALHELKDK
jgi:cytidine deaminase